MNTRTIFMATAFGLMCNMAYGLENEAPNTMIEQPTHYKAMDRGMFHDQVFDRMDMNDAQVVKFRDALKMDPDLVRFIDVVKFERSGDTLIITGVVNDEATKAKIESKVKAVPGVDKVDNRLIVK